jgi:type I restriction enzyme S subunit
MSEVKELPQGWITEKLLNVCDEISAGGDVPKNNFSPNKTDEFQVPIFANGEKNKGLYGYTNIPKIAIPSVTISARGSIGFTEFRSMPFCPIVRLIVLCPSKNLDAQFLKYALDNSKITNTGTTIPQLTVPTVKEIYIPIPPLAEQHRIVAKIEELFSSLDKGIESLKTVQAQLKVYRQAVLKWAFEGKLTNKNVKEGELPKGWEWKTIGDVTKKLDQGWSPKCENDSSKNINEWAVIKTTAIQHGKFWDNENKILPLNLVPRTQHEIKENDILITRAGPRIRVGVCCLVKNVRPKLLNCDKAYRIKADLIKVEPSYLVQLLNTQRFLTIIDKCKSGGNDSGLNLTQNVFLAIKVPFPPTLSEQTQIVAEIESRLSVCDKIEESISTSLLQAEALRQSILKKAFEGKLVAQDPNDEPASVLLERIKAERERTASEGRKVNSIRKSKMSKSPSGAIQDS